METGVTFNVCHLSMNKKYIFTSERLGFRNWLEEDLDPFAEMNADPRVMEHFPELLKRNETASLIQRLQGHFEQRGHTYFACDLLESQKFIGFIGFYYQEYKTEFNPANDIGWRLMPSAWGMGYATEGAKRCVEFAFDELKLDRLVATCPRSNTGSENVMRKIGMTRKGNFLHPKLDDYPALQKSVYYELLRAEQA